MQIKLFFMLFAASIKTFRVILSNWLLLQNSYSSQFVKNYKNFAPIEKEINKINK